MNNEERRTLVILLLICFCAIFGRSQAQKQTRTVTSVDDVTVVYEVHGEGAIALVFVHGWSCDRSYWKGQINFFTQNYKIVNIDLGGHGESGLGREDWTIYSFGTDVASVVKALKLEKVILIGHSMGGDVIVDAAMQLPGRVSGLIMVDTYQKLDHGRSMEQIQTFVDNLAQDFPEKVKQLVANLYLPESDPSLVDAVATDMSSAPSDVALSAIKSSFTHSRLIAHDLEILKLPVIAINAGYQPTDIESLQRHGVETIVMPDVGHFLMMEDSERFNDLLLLAIEKILN